MPLLWTRGLAPAEPLAQGWLAQCALLPAGGLGQRTPPLGIHTRSLRRCHLPLVWPMSETGCPWAGLSDAVEWARGPPRDCAHLRSPRSALASPAVHRAARHVDPTFPWLGERQLHLPCQWIFTDDHTDPPTCSLIGKNPKTVTESSVSLSSFTCVCGARGVLRSWPERTWIYYI